MAIGSAKIEEVFTFEMDTSDLDDAITSRGLEALLHTIQAAVAHMAEDGTPISAMLTLITAMFTQNCRHFNAD